MPAEDLLTARLKRLRHRIEWIREELEKRRALHEEFESEIEADVLDLSVRSASMTYPAIRQSLENELRKLKKDRRNNAAKAWKDALDLTDRLLELLDEYERLLALESILRRKGP